MGIINVVSFFGFGIDIAALHVEWFHKRTVGGGC